MLLTFLYIFNILDLNDSFPDVITLNWDILFSFTEYQTTHFFQVNNPEVSEPEPGNIKVVTASFALESSGMLKCETSNEHGSGNAVNPISISGMYLYVCAFLVGCLVLKEGIWLIMLRMKSI